MDESRSRLSFFAKLAFSAGLLGYVFARVDWAELVDVFSRTDWRFVALYLLVSPCILLMSTLKWGALLRAKSIDVAVSRLFALYLVGQFFNYLMPSNFGGDAVRTYRLGRDTGNLDEAAASVFVERMTGLTVLLLLVSLAVVINLKVLGDGRVIGALGLVFVAYAAVAWLVADPRPIGWLTSRVRWPLLKRFADFVDRVHAAILRYRDERRVWIPAVGLSVAFYALILLNAYLGCMSFGQTVPAWSIVAAIPVILVITMVPISVGGVGLLEWAYFAMFEQVGLPGALGLSVALLNRGAGLLTAGIGGLIYSRSRPHRERREDYVVAPAAASGETR